eukprot:1147635-Pelagomonas_calceolata.AAC.7
MRAPSLLAVHSRASHQQSHVTVLKCVGAEHCVEGSSQLYLYLSAQCVPLFPHLQLSIALTEPPNCTERSIALTEPYDWARHKMLQAALVSVKNARIADKHAGASQLLPSPILSSEPAHQTQHSKPSRLAAVTHGADRLGQEAQLAVAAPAAEDDGSHEEGNPSPPSAPISTLEHATASAAPHDGNDHKESNSPTASAPTGTLELATASAAPHDSNDHQESNSPTASAPTGTSELAPASAAQQDSNNHQESNPPTAGAVISTAGDAAAPGAHRDGAPQERSSPTDSAPIGTSGAAPAPAAPLMGSCPQEKSSPINSIAPSCKHATAPAATLMGSSAQDGKAGSADPCRGDQQQGDAAGKRGSEEGAQQDADGAGAEALQRDELDVVLGATALHQDGSQAAERAKADGAGVAVQVLLNQGVTLRLHTMVANKGRDRSQK